MSGGAFDYKQTYLHQLADEIEGTFIKRGKFESEDWSAARSPSFRGFGDDIPKIEKDYFEGATIEQRELLLKEIDSLIIDLNNCARRVKHLDWFLSGDTGVKSYIECLKKDGLIE